MTISQNIINVINDPIFKKIKNKECASRLLLDYDGTLAPFCEERDKAYPYKSILPILKTLPREGVGSYIIVTGREPHEITALLHKHSPEEIWGNHGACRMQRNVITKKAMLTEKIEKGLEEAALVLPTDVKQNMIERKSTSLALHWRGLPQQQVEKIQSESKELWSTIAATHDLELHPFNGGLELRVPGLNKSQPIQTLHDEIDNLSLIYIGDDLTDEDAFRSLAKNDIGILASDAPRQTAAKYRITTPTELVQFLIYWKSII